MRSGVVERQSPEDVCLELYLLSGPLTDSSKACELRTFVTLCTWQVDFKAIRFIGILKGHFKGT